MVLLLLLMMMMMLSLRVRFTRFACCCSGSCRGELVYRADPVNGGSIDSVLQDLVRESHKPSGEVMNVRRVALRAELMREWSHRTAVVPGGAATWGGVLCCRR